MTRRNFLQTATAAAMPAAAQTPRSRPNILFIMTDQHRFDALGTNGNKLIRTPNLDRLAAESANFQNCFVQAPVCVPSRATFFTGRYPHSHRNRVNYTPLKSDEVLMQQHLKDAGYRTGSVGKLHLYPPTAEHARNTGFDHVQMHDGVGSTNPFSDYEKWRARHDPLAHLSYRALAKDIESGRNPYRMAIADEHTETVWVSDLTQKYLRDFAGRPEPFFLYSSYFQPHSPFLAPEPFDSMYDDVEIPLPKAVTLDEIKKLPKPLQSLILRGNNPSYNMDRERLQWAFRTYYASVSQIDREVGALLRTLQESGMAENTIVIFSTDHGDQMLEHGLMGKNCFFEASVHIPFMIRWPGMVRPGKYDELIETTDLLPTLFDLCGIPEPDSSQGRSLAPLMRGQKTAPREAVFSENIIPEVITTGSLDFAFEKGKGIKGIRHPEAKMVRTKDWKLNYYGDGEGELYHLAEDPNEERNLFTDASAQIKVQEMKGRLLDWLMTADETDQIASRWLL